MRPLTVTVPEEGLVMPATSFNAVLLPDPFRPADEAERYQPVRHGQRHE